MRRSQVTRRRRPSASFDVFERVAAYVERHPGCDAGEVALGAGVLGRAAAPALRRLELAGFLERDRGGRYRSFKPYRPR
jgi:hypothetical protein